MSIQLPAEAKRQIGSATRSVRECIKGSVLADIWECNVSNISQAERNGHGEIRKVVETIIACRSAEHFGATKAQVDSAIEKVVKVIANSGGYICYRPINDNREVHDLLKAAS